MVVGGPRQQSRYSPSIERQTMMPSQVINVPSYRGGQASSTPTNQYLKYSPSHHHQQQPQQSPHQFHHQQQHGGTLGAAPRNRPDMAGLHSRERPVMAASPEQRQSTISGGPMPDYGGRHHSQQQQQRQPPPVTTHRHHGPLGGGIPHHHHQMTLSDIPETSRVSNARSDLTVPDDSQHGLTSSHNQQLRELECDYDTSATQLYELLESSDWERARGRCRTHPEEVRTWIVRKDKSQQVRWKLLPLHAAIIFQAPSFVVSSLLERYPAAASRKDDQGMLPLHLAFRHKQEDEDLLELLLVQYPQAVMLRDRRDRTPLEHGRESRYSSKLMRLYGEAMTNASAALSPKKHGSGAAGAASHTTTATDSLTHSMSNTHSQLARLEAENEAKMAVIKADYEYQIKTMQGKYEDRIQAIQNKSNAALRQVELASSEKERKLHEEHADEINELREILQRQVNKDKAVTESLQREVSHLSSSLDDAKAQSEILNERYNQIVADNEQLRDFLDRIYEDQAVIQEIATKQQDYLEAARSIRAELVQTLLKQEDADGQNDRLRGTKLVEIANNVQRRIHEFVEHHPMMNVNHHPDGGGGGDDDMMRMSPRSPNNNGGGTTPRHHHIEAVAATPAVEAYHTEPSTPHMSSPVAGRHRANTKESVGMSSLERKGPSRIEVERGNEESDMMYSSDQQGQTEVQAFYVVQGEDPGAEAAAAAAAAASSPKPKGGGTGGGTGTGGNGAGAGGTSGKAEQRQEEYAETPREQDGGQQEEDYGEVRILGDEISAITENSAY